MNRAPRQRTRPSRLRICRRPRTAGLARRDSALLAIAAVSALAGVVAAAPTTTATGIVAHDHAAPTAAASDVAARIPAGVPGAGAATLNYVVPDVTLVRDDGKTVSLRQEMNDGRPVVLNFIYTSCGSICPLMSQIFAGFQQRLGTDRDQVHLMSISTDPEADTPARLRDYARKFGAGPEWQHYTGSLDVSLTTQRAFDVYRGDKMSHTPVTLLRMAPGAPWRRIEGFVAPDELLREYRQPTAAR